MKLPFPPRFFPSSPEPLENRIAPAVINPIDLTTLNGADGFRLNGQNGSHAGFSTASAGDVNGDGFEDVIVGAYFGGIGYGAAYVVFGRANGSPAASDLAALDGSSGFIITGNASGGRFGSSVSGAGDLNGDGFDDLIVSARRDPGNGNNSGAAFVVFGHAGGFANLDVATLNGSNGFKLGGANPEDAAGSMVSGAGDVNGDGFADLLVSALGVNAGGSSGGAAYVVFGKANGFAANLPLASLDGGNGFRLTGIMANDFVGTSLAAVGDVNGDGFGDILIGATGADPNGSRSGAAYLVFGKANGFAPSLSLSALNGANGAVFRGVAANDIAGVSVGGAGDLNGDGLADFVIGASGANAAGAYSGAAYVIYGKTAAFAPAVELSGLDGTTGFRLGGESAADSAGYSVSLAGDINGDGLDDLVVGAINAEIGAPGQSGAYVLYGKTGGFGANMSLGSIDGQNGFKLTSGGPFSSTGTAVGAGDVNGDGYDDVIVGARFGNGSMPGSGAAYVVFGFSSGSVTREGGAGADMLNGTAGADIFVSGQLNDTAQGAGGADVFHGGQGDDLFTIGDGGFGRVDGGRGTDTLKFGGGFALDLTALRDGKLTGIEKIDLVGGAGSLTLDLREVLHLSDTANTLVVRSDSDDVVNIGAGWIPGATEIIDGETFSIFTQGAATLKLGGPAAAVTLVSPSVATFTDVDGDLVTIKVNKGTLGLADFVVVPRGSVGGLQLLAVNFSDDGAEFQDANLTISAVRGPLGGDGGVNVGLIQATGVDLGKVGVEGDLGVVFAGDAALATPGLDALSVRSIGLLGTSTQSFGGSAISRVEGKLGTLAVATDMVDHQFNARAVPGGIAYGAIKVGGSIRGSTAFTGIVSNGAIGSLEIGHDLRGGSGTFSGIVTTTDAVGSVVIGGSLAGNSDLGSGSLFIRGAVGSVKIGGDIDGGNLYARDAIKSLVVAGSVLNAEIFAGYSGHAVPENGDATIGPVKVGGDWVASDLVAGAIPGDAFFGNGGDSLMAGNQPASVAKIVSIAIRGEVLGTPGGTDHFGFIAEEIGAFSAGGTKFPLTAKESNDLAGLAAGSTLDVRVREVNGTVPPVEAPAGAPGFNLGAIDGTNGFRFDGDKEGETAGNAVSGIGDINNDGFDDVIIGARGAGTGFAGAAYVVFGKAAGFDVALNPAALDGSNGFILTRGIADAQFGLGVGAAGDVNGDGIDDLIVGQIENLGLGGSRTSAFVVFGKNSPFSAALDVSTLDGTNGFEIHAPVNADNGVAYKMGVSGAGDLNGDGRDDLILGVTNADFAGQLSGSFYIFFSPVSGSPASLDGGTLNGTNGFRFDGPTTGVFTGYAASRAGDINGDGFDDLLLGVSNENVTARKQGAAYVVFGKASSYPAILNPAAVIANSGALGFRLLGVEELNSTGATVDAAGDVNGDGIDDLIVGAPYADPGGTYSGASYVVYGKTGAFGAELPLSSLNGSNGFRLTGATDYDYSGRVAGVGDVNGDGFDDLLVGAIGIDAKFEFRGGAYLIFGGASKPASVSLASGLKLSGAAAGDQAGGDVSGAGDVNGDGLADLLIGADHAGNGSRLSGSAYVVFRAGLASDLVIAPGGKMASFTDVDGDRVTVKSSAGQFQLSDFTLVREGNLGGSQLRKLDLSGPAHAAFDGASITITAIRGAAGGDGFVNIGAIAAAGIDLGRVTIEGDLGQIDAGDGDALRPALGGLAVHSIGRLGLSTQDPAGASLESEFLGRLGTLNVSSDVAGAVLRMEEGGAITIGGALRGGPAANAGRIVATGDLGTVKIGQGIIGGAGAFSGSIEAAGNIGGVLLGNSLLGGAGAGSGSLIAGLRLGVIKIAGDLVNAHLFAQGSVLPGNAAAAVAIKSLALTASVQGSEVHAGYDRNGLPVNADASIGRVRVGGDWFESNLVAGVETGLDGFFGNGDLLVAGGNAIVAKIAGIQVRGQAFGSIRAGDHFGFVAEEIAAFKGGMTPFKLAKGASTDTGGVAIGATDDLRVREV